MQITDLKPELENLYCTCLEEWSDEMREAGDHKKCWLEGARTQGLRVKLALDDDGNGAGMIQYMPIEHTHVKGENLYFIYCIWVHGYKEGQGNYQKKGIGTKLLEAAEQDARELGARGIAAWGVSLPFYMRASWYKKKGYKACSRDGIAVLLWKAFCEDANAPEWVKQKKEPASTDGQITVHSFKNGWCPAQNIAYERAKRAADEIGAPVVFREYRTSDPEVFEEWGIVDALYVNSRKIRLGPPPSYEKIRSAIEKEKKRARL
ncbi:MAG: GNAT family N-acetyltransferase [Spirochaetales bacterium]|jgi:GNAT superfamily N-acetyltransferase|nr:GNAT family N-acetyltransferase [Spirochaetales bacterium]